MSYTPHTQAARFWARVKRCAHGESCEQCCWPWQGSTSTGGYGRTRFMLLGEPETYTHRVAFALHTKRLAGKKEVCHSCDNPLCCNPLHLWIGTHRENHWDSMRKGRRYHPPSLRKLTQAQVRRIPIMYNQERLTQRAIAALLGVSQPLIARILKRSSPV
jgi:hypothetical protein